MMAASSEADMKEKGKDKIRGSADTNSNGLMKLMIRLFTT